MVTTSASLKSNSNRSPNTNFTLSVTPAASALALASAILSGLRSTPTPVAPNFSAAVITIRPSPHPRSYTTSPGFTPASFSIYSTVAWLVGTYGTTNLVIGAYAYDHSTKYMAYSHNF